MLKMVDLFSGLGGASQAMVDSPHWEVLRVDNFPLLRDVPHTMLADLTEDFAFDAHWFNPKVVWASPPCTSFSVASISTYWKGGKGAYIPKKAESYIGMALVQKAKDLIDYFKPKYYYIENPRGVLRKLDVVQNLPIRHTIWYCQYGDSRAKPTDIWTNDDTWIPRPVCKNGNPDCDHERAPRGSRTGTQGLKGNYERSIVPSDLCRKIISKVEVHLFTLKHGGK